ncbi:glycosyltransferase [Acidithiobacillus concretivorus]|uniref:Glycosyltransferase n=1 Tax=Acidithiobacillus concretivorus TaxID=3063952 RepID=A0ABS5ZKS0_9PROT|nr:glycosyltransferase [Acidithiobacillus concretivorus]MBU2737242.1 glycosyltransferase [Acidithiobacillus concretivorus]
MKSDTFLPISVAMATYNGERFIKDQLKSIASQTLLPIELVITDDGSSDETCVIISEFAKISPFPVRLYLNEKKLGYRDNFIKAAYLCTGDLIAFSDQDDIWDNDKLKIQHQYFSDPKVAMVSHPYQVMDTEGRCTNIVFPKMKSIKEYSAADFNPFFSYYGMTLMFRKEILPSPECINKRPIDHNTFEHLMSHDQWIPFLAISSQMVVFLPKALTRYRQHNNNTAGPQPYVTYLDRLLKLAFSQSSENDYKLYCKLSLSLLERVDSLMSGCQSSTTATYNNVERTIDFYKWLSEKYSLRAAMYDLTLTRLERLSLFLKALFSGAYKKRTKGLFGITGAVKDLINICSIGVLR